MSEIDKLFRGETKTVLVPAIIEIVDELRDYWYRCPAKFFVLPGSKKADIREPSINGWSVPIAVVRH